MKKVSPVVVREFLLRCMRYNLLKPVKCGQWRMKKFEQDYAEKLFELREMLGNPRVEPLFKSRLKG